MDDVRLVQIGGASKEADKERVEGLKRMVKKLGVEVSAYFHPVNHFHFFSPFFFLRIH
jgi:hypothetical protein